MPPKAIQNFKKIIFFKKIKIDPVCPQKPPLPLKDIIIKKKTKSLFWAVPELFFI